MNATFHHEPTPRALRAASALCCLLAVLTGGTGAWAGEASSVADDVAIVQPFIGPTTTFVLKVDPTRLALPDLSDTLKATAPGSEEAYRAWSREVGEGLEALRAATSGQAVYATIGIPVSSNEWPAFFFLKGKPDADPKQLLDGLNALSPMESCTRDGYFVAMPGRRADVAAAVDALVPSPREVLTGAFEAVASYPIQVLILPPDYVRRTVAELLPRLPRQLGGGPSDVLTEGLVWAALGVDLAQLHAELVVQSGSEEAARGLSAHLGKMLQSAYNEVPEINTRIPRETYETLLPLIAPQIEGDRFTVRLAGLERTGGTMRLVTLLGAAIQDRVRRNTNADKFKQILLAMHNYHDSYKAFPPRDEVRDESGRSKLSWRVHILPFLEEVKLYEEFHIDEPWDSPHNKRLVAKMPKVYQSPGFGLKPGHTTFLAPVGEDTVFGGRKATKLSNVTDGTSNTVVLVEVKPEWAAPWTAPEDYAFDPKAPGRGLAVGADGRFLAAFGDGSAQLLRGNLEPELLLRLFQKSDGHPIDRKAIR